MTQLNILCVTPSSSAGWGPVTSMAELAGSMFDTRPTFWHPHRAYGHARKLASLVPRPTVAARDRALLVIASHPGDLLALTHRSVWAGRYDRVGVWIIDSFWDERIPLFARRRAAFDAAWVTDGELVPRYAETLGVDVGWLPWGTDALAAALLPPTDESPIDVFRLGRQPEGWDSDDANAEMLSRAGLTYAGRFPDHGSGTQNQRTVRSLLNRSKIVLASSPLASGSQYTHPTRDYISARFTDSAAAGAQVAGVPPHGMAASLLPAAQLVPMDVTSPARSVETLVAAVQAHSPQVRAGIRRSALLNLDWRYRFLEIARTLQVSAPNLAMSLDRLRQQAAMLP